MNGSCVNSSFQVYFWEDCDNYYDSNGAGRLEGSSAGLLILFITYAVEFALAVPSKIWLICHIIRQSKRSKHVGILPADFFPLHQALAQLSFCLVMPLLFVNHVLWRSNSVLAVVTFQTSMVIVLKPLLLCVVCVERYLAVVRPLLYLRVRGHQFRWGYLGVLWSITMVMATIGLTGRSPIAIATVFLPVLAIGTFCSLSVLKTLKRPLPGDRQMGEEEEEDTEKVQKQVRDEAEKRKTHKWENGSQQEIAEEGKQEKSSRKEEKAKKDRNKRREGKMNSMKRKAFITIVIIQVVLTLNYFPFIITLPLNETQRTLKCQFLAMGLAAAASCSYLQPLLYLHRLGRVCERATNYDRDRQRHRAVHFH